MLRTNPLQRFFGAKMKTLWCWAKISGVANTTSCVLRSPESDLILYISSQLSFNHINRKFPVQNIGQIQEKENWKILNLEFSAGSNLLSSKDIKN
jgi:hypothetical protein